MNSTAGLLNRNRPLAVTLASLLMAILFGLISTTANYIVISIAVALFSGAFLLARPEWIAWIILSIGLLVVGIAPIYNEKLEKIGWAISALCFVLMLVAFFKAVTSPEIRKNTPPFIWLLLVFIIYAALNSLFQWHSAEELIGGFKRYFQMWGLLFALCWMAFDERHIRRWQGFFLIVALVQLPFAVYEHIALVPVREGMQHSLPDMVPIDVVGGTFGSTLYGGGNSGEMATFLVIVLAFLMARRMEKVVSTGSLVLLIPWVLAPLFLGETKAVIIMLPMMLAVLNRRKLLIKPHYALMLVAVCALLLAGMAYAYESVMHIPLDKLFRTTLEYNLYNKGYGGNFLNRTTVLTFWAGHQGAHDPIAFLFGNGLGSSHQQTGGHLDIRYFRYGIGLTAVSTLLWDMGILGCALFAAILVSAWQAAGQVYRKSTEPMIRADAIAIQASLSLFFFHIFYRIELLENIAVQIVFASMLGYLAYLYRRYTGSVIGGRP